MKILLLRILLFFSFLTSSLSPAPKSAKMEDLSCFGDMWVTPVFADEAYVLEVRYLFHLDSAHYLTAGWQSEYTTNMNTFHRQSYPNSYFPIPYTRYQGGEGDEVVLDLYIPASYIASTNSLILFDHNGDTGREKATTFRLSPTTRFPEKGVDLLESSSLRGYNRFYIDEYGRSEVMLEETTVYGASSSYYAKDGVVPLSKLNFNFAYWNSQRERAKEDRELSLVVLGDNYKDFTPYVSAGATREGKTIRIPLRLEEQDGGWRPILDPSIKNIDLGCGVIKKSKEVILPYRTDIATYQMRLENRESGDLDFYYFSFDLDTAYPYLGSCQDARWCVEVH